MATGRCAGCGRTDSLRKMNLHVIDCQEFTKIYAEDPAAALPPAAEFERYQLQDRADARSDQRDQRRRGRFAQINREQAASASRWACPPDILQ